MFSAMRIFAVSVCLLHGASICWAASIGSPAEQITQPLLGRQEPSEPSSEVSSSTSPLTTTTASDTTTYDNVEDEVSTISSTEVQINPSEDGSIVESTLTTSTTTISTDIDDNNEEGPEDAVVFLVVSSLEEALQEIIHEADGVTSTSTPEAQGTTASSPQSEHGDKDDSDEDEDDDDDDDDDDEYSDEDSDEDELEFNRNKGIPQKGKITSINKTVQKGMTENVSTTKVVKRERGRKQLLSTSGEIDATGLKDVVSDVNMQKQKSNIEGLAPKEVIQDGIHTKGIDKSIEERVKDVPLKLAGVKADEVGYGVTKLELVEFERVDEAKLLDTLFKTMDGQQQVIVPIVPELINKPL